LVKEDESGIYRGILLFRRGIYSNLCPFIIINAASPEGITTRKLLDEIGSHAANTQRVIYKADKLGLIKRKAGEEPGPGQFSPICNAFTDKGPQLLQNHLVHSGISLLLKTLEFTVHLLYAQISISSVNNSPLGHIKV
jgi:hypothetical protein